MNFEVIKFDGVLIICNATSPNARHVHDKDAHCKTPPLSNPTLVIKTKKHIRENFCTMDNPFVLTWPISIDEIWRYDCIFKSITKKKASLRRPFFSISDALLYWRSTSRSAC